MDSATAPAGKLLPGEALSIQLERRRAAAEPHKPEVAEEAARRGAWTEL